jgi:ATP-dependent helicase Lhr and Lhr-like helicase
MSQLVATAPALDWAHPLVREWFVSKFGTPTEPQEQGWPHILAGRTTLISAPTGSGKTLAAFLACIDRLVRKALGGELRDRTEVLYVSPLKALGNDIQKNLEQPLSEILQLAGRKGLLMPVIRTAVRTGDTLMHERRAMLKRPPHILVTTPESLYILLTAEKSREILRDVETVIVDEIHAVAGSKRGAHLALSLERLEAITRRTPSRIGLSATQKPLETIAHFLTGNGVPHPSRSEGWIYDPVLVNIGHKRQMDIAVEVPRSELGPVASNEMWDETYDRIAELVRQHRSTLVFVNTRRLAERIAMHLGERLGEDSVAAHHGSLSRKLRLEAERKLKAGELSVLVATASLELGIDIGTVDLVCQISSPRSIAIALQRVGRSGHWRGAIPKARLFAITRDELLECAALVRSIHRGELDRIIMPEAPLDVLAQQIVAEVAARAPARTAAALAAVARTTGPRTEAVPTADAEASDTGIPEDDLFSLMRRAYPYRELPRREFDELIAMLSDGIAARRGRYGAYLHHDRVHRRLRPRRGARLAAITSGGAIPDTGQFAMVSMPEQTTVGTLDEDFAVESNRGDIILLGNTSWRIMRVEGATGRVLVEDAHGAPPNVPFWRGEAPARTAELSEQLAELRQAISHMLPRSMPVKVPLSGRPPEIADAIEFLRHECGLDELGAELAIEHILAGRAVLGAVPTQQTVIAERFFDEGGGMQLVIHAPFGARINKAWGLALRKRFCRSFNFELQAAATDDGINIALAEQHSFPLGDVFNYLSPETVQDVLEQAVLTGSPLFGTRWRWDATRALALLRFQHGRKVPPQIQRIRSDDLLASVFPDVAACGENIVGDIKVPDHPLVREVMKDVLHEAMDIDGLKQVLHGIESGTIRSLAVDTPVPSQFSHEILNANPHAYLDDAPLEERRARAVQMRQVLPESVLEKVGKLDPEAIAQVREEAWPDVRDPDELHDALQTLVAVPAPGRSSDATDAVILSGASASDAERRIHAFPASATQWQPFFDHLATTQRAAIAVADGRRFWIAAERVPVFKTIFPNSRIEMGAAPFPNGEGANNVPSRSEAIHQLVTGWLAHLGPVTAHDLAQLFGLSQNEIDQALLQIESTGAVLRGNFTARTDGQTEWCDRRLLVRIHRLTIGRLRREIEPVTPAQYMNWLLHWQHVAPGTQVTGERGTLEVVRQLQGFEIPASAWEREVLARRILHYDPSWLDRLCLTGAVGWGRLSPHPAILEENGRGRDALATAGGTPALHANRRVIPTSVAPITLFVREESDWMSPRHPEHDRQEVRGLSPTAQQVLTFLRQRGASFFPDIVRGAFKLKSEVETALWELVAAGLVTADGFDNLRALIDPKRRAGQGHGRASRPRHSAGRWSLLYTGDQPDRARLVEATCWMLLKRCGVVLRDALARETNLPRWREMLVGFRRLEDRGEIRGGRFVNGFLGEQFALPVAVESLRASRKQQPRGEVIAISAADPLNLVGIIVPGERVPAVSGKYVGYRDGVPADVSPREAYSFRLSAS